MNTIRINDDISLVPYYPNYKTAFRWYLDPDVCRQVDNRDKIYDLDLLKRMYKYLNKNGYLYYIKYKNHLCGDVCLEKNGYLAIVVCKEYQNKHIGRTVIQGIIELAKEKGFHELKAEIYSFNTQSKRMFESIGFQQMNEEEYVYSIKK